jgi:hypothetical protein
MNPSNLHLRYIVDENNQKSSVILPLEEFTALIEDLEDLAAVAEQRSDSTISHQELLDELKKDGFAEILTAKRDDELIAAAMQRAKTEHTTLEELLRHWLADYTQQNEQLDAFDHLTTALRGKVRIGKKLTRDELNER